MIIEVKSAGSDLGDYYWTNELSKDSSSERYLRDLDKAYSALIAAHEDGTYSVLLHRMRTTPEKRDAHNRLITASIHVAGITEKEARSLLISYFQNRAATEYELCNGENIKINESGFFVDKQKMKMAVGKLTQTAQSLGEDELEKGEIWSEGKALERQEELIAWLKRYRLSSASGPRVICSHFLIADNIPAVDLALFVSGEGEYTRPAPTESGPTYPNSKRVWIGIGITAAVIMLAWGTWRVVKRLNTPNPVKLEQSVQKPESPTAHNPS